MAFSKAQEASPLARVPYHLRHAAVSLWLNAGVPAPQVAEWAGHSVHVLMKVYASASTARRRQPGTGSRRRSASPPDDHGGDSPGERRREYDATSEIEGA